MSGNRFLLNTTEIDTKILDIQHSALWNLNWMLWKTWFRVDYFHIESNDNNFHKDIRGVVSLDTEETTFPGVISETPYASGNFTHV